MFKWFLLFRMKAGPPIAGPGVPFKQASFLGSREGAKESFPAPEDRRLPSVTQGMLKEHSQKGGKGGRRTYHGPGSPHTWLLREM